MPAHFDSTVRDRAEPRRSSIIYGALAALFVSVSLWTALKVPPVFQDEVYYSDPAANLADGFGFHSTTWGTSPRSELFTSSAPLYSLALAAWLSLWGFSIEAVRSFPYVLAGGAGVSLWIASCRLRIIATPTFRFFLLALLFCDFGFAFSYRGGRPDALSLLLCSLIPLGFSLQSLKHRLLLCGAASMIIPFAGVGPTIFTGTAATLLLPIYWRRFSLELTTVLMTLMVGVALFVAAHVQLGLWDDFRHLVESEGSSSIFQRVWERLTSNPLMHHRNALPKDFSLFILLPAVIAVALRKMIGHPAGFRSAEAICLFLCAGVTASLYLVGKFPTYYSWMLVVPLGLAIGASASTTRSVALKRFYTCTVILAVLVGLPFQIAAASFDWNARNVESFNQWVQSRLQDEDVAFLDYPFYYGTRGGVSDYYLNSYVPMLTEEDAARITVLLLSPDVTEKERREPLFDRLGPGWQVVDSYEVSERGLFGNGGKWGYLSLPTYSCLIYRRTSATPARSGTSPDE